MFPFNLPFNKNQNQHINEILDKRVKLCSQYHNDYRIINIKLLLTLVI